MICNPIQTACTICRIWLRVLSFLLWLKDYICDNNDRMINIFSCVLCFCKPSMHDCLDICRMSRHAGFRLSLHTYDHTIRLSSDLSNVDTHNLDHNYRFDLCNCVPQFQISDHQSFGGKPCDVLLDYLDRSIFCDCTHPHEYKNSADQVLAGHSHQWDRNSLHTFFFKPS